MAMGPLGRLHHLLSAKQVSSCPSSAASHTNPPFPISVAIDDWFDIKINTTSTTSAIMSVPPPSLSPINFPNRYKQNNHQPLPTPRLHHLHHKRPDPGARQRRLGGRAPLLRRHAGRLPDLHRRVVRRGVCDPNDGYNEPRHPRRQAVPDPEPVRVAGVGRY